MLLVQREGPLNADKCSVQLLFDSLIISAYIVISLIVPPNEEMQVYKELPYSLDPLSNTPSVFATSVLSVVALPKLENTKYRISTLYRDSCCIVNRKYAVLSLLAQSTLSLSLCNLLPALLLTRRSFMKCPRSEQDAYVEP
jgi:hypothetical protein